MSFGIVWMLAQALTPALVGRAIDQGVAEDDTSRLLLWAGALLGIGVVGAVAGVFRHRFSVTNWLTAAYRTVQLVVRRSTDVGAALPQQVPTGEVVSIGATDLAHIGGLMDIAGRMAGAVVSFVVVAVILLDASRTLGLVVLIGVPLLLLAIGPLLKPLQARTLVPARAHRAAQRPGRRHRRRTPRAARHRRRAGLPRPLRARVAAGTQRRRPGGPAAVGARRAAGAAARHVRRAGRVAGRPARRAGRDQRGRAGRVLRLRGVPDDAAAHLHRVRQQADPRPGRRRPRLPAVARSSRRSRTRPTRCRCPATASWSTRRRAWSYAPG